MLMQMNSTAVSSISATINGEAYVLAAGTEEEKWCKEQHLANNTFGESEGAAGIRNAEQMFGTSPSATDDGGKASYIEDDQVRVVVVKIKDGRISDWKGSVKDWVITGRDEGPTTVGGGAVTMNGVAPAPTALPDGQSVLQ